jgi:hypothetical protein
MKAAQTPNTRCTQLRGSDSLLLTCAHFAMQKAGVIPTGLALFAATAAILLAILCYSLFGTLAMALTSCIAAAIGARGGILRRLPVCSLNILPLSFVI